MSNALFDALTPEQRHIDLGSGRFVRLVDVMGDDSRVVQAARVSYGAGTKTLREDRGLIFHLMRNAHTSPFEMPKALFHIRAEMFSKNQMVRTRTAQWNEESARFSEMRDDFWVPDPSDVRIAGGTNKQGSLNEPNPRGPEAVDIIHRNNVRAYEEYQKLLAMDVPREQARAVLPQTILVEWYYCIDLNNLTKTMKLRLDPHSQLEVRQIFGGIHQLFAACFPVINEAFEYCILNGATFTQGQLQILQTIVRGNMERSAFLAFVEASIPSKDERETLIRKVWPE